MAPRKETRCVASIELVAFRDMTRGVQVQVSIPGRDGMATRSWKPLNGHALSASQRLDFATWITTTANNWLTLAFAEQLKLAFGEPPVASGEAPS